MKASIDVIYGGKKIPSGQIPEAFLKYGLDGIRAFSFQIGNEQAEAQERKGNKVAFISVDGYKFRSPSEMKRNITWDFSKANSQLKAAVIDALSMLRSNSLSLAGDPTGAMAESWGLYINGKPATIEVLDEVRIGQDDIRITSHLAYARFLEAGYWTGTKALQKRLSRGQKRLAGKRIRGNLAATQIVSNALARQYKGLSIADVWYDGKNHPNPFGYNFGDSPMGKARWPAIVFNVRKRVI